MVSLPKFTSLRVIAVMLVGVLLTVWTVPAAALRPTGLEESPQSREALTQALQGGVANPSRRRMLHTTALGAAALFFPGFARAAAAAQPPQDAPPNALQPSQTVTGALAPLKLWLGNQLVELMIWDPQALMEAPAPTEQPMLDDFFRQAVAVGVDRVWVSSTAFFSTSEDHPALTAAQQRALLTSAAKAGLKSFGLISGDPAWAGRAYRLAVRRHYAGLTAVVAQRLTELEREGALKDLQVVLGADIEPYIRQPDETEQAYQQRWQGDLSGYIETLRGEIVPAVQALADRSRRVQRDLIRFEPFWYENGHTVEGRGIVLRGLQPVARTTLAAMTYRNTASELIEAFGPAGRRARAEGRSTLGVETKTREPGTMAGRELEIPALIITALNRLGPDVAAGVFIHAEDPTTAYAMLKQWRAVPMPQPAAAFGVPGKAKVTPAAITAELALTADQLSRRLVAVPVILGDLLYPQPKADGSVTYPVVGNRVTVESAEGRPFVAGKVGLVVMDRDHVKAFFEANGQGARQLTVGGPIHGLVVVKDEAGTTEVVQELRAGLEELDRLATMWGLTDARLLQVIAVSPEVARLYPELQGVIGQPVALGAHVRFLIVPERSDVIRDLIVSFMEHSSVIVRTYGPLVGDEALDNFERQVLRARLPRLPRQPLFYTQGMTLPTMLRQVIESLVTVDQQPFIRDEDLRTLADALGTLAPLA